MKIPGHLFSGDPLPVRPETAAPRLVKSLYFRLVENHYVARARQCVENGVEYRFSTGQYCFRNRQQHTEEPALSINATGSDQGASRSVTIRLAQHILTQEGRRDRQQVAL